MDDAHKALPVCTVRGGISDYMQSISLANVETSLLFFRKL